MNAKRAVNEEKKSTKGKPAAQSLSDDVDKRQLQVSSPRLRNPINTGVNLVAKSISPGLRRRDVVLESQIDVLKGGNDDISAPVTNLFPDETSSRFSSPSVKETMVTRNRAKSDPKSPKVTMNVERDTKKGQTVS